MLMMKPPLKPATPIKPQLSEAEAVILQHDSYVVQKHMHLCTRCNSTESFTTLWEVWCHPIKANIVQRRATTEIKPDFAFRVVQMPAKDIPVCFNCAGSFRAEEADPTTPLSVAAWQETLRRKYAPAPAAEEKKSGKITPTLDML